MITHVDKKNRPTMVDISDKKVTLRIATASARVQLPKEVKEIFSDGELITKKGPVIDTAIVAGTMAAKKTHELIPFCHPLSLDSCKIEINTNQAGDLIINCKVSIEHKTGVEMEALTGASVAALTIYDMCKSLSHEIVITDVALEQKSGGKRDIG
ncbi:MAG: cyclic pyranopterin monophosphate synthase MoaC [Gammaproteobacteria bacterium]|jgi:cyclic pyranopterin phosphate synthase|nr:cyclic pyranopterin monophosphate synthase MoaC [Gammaproteobacteria bacterium]